ncbi:non-canonical purine NTP diphosphatase [Arcicella sp. LKC2W]|uniref:non-canonical purine NTP diphosphatase n=1 Tax=Arcicella sp. LKC2W TaxID=2984198 RepID=UPI002B1FF428|nr:non-canonical purine NTP diphosphatase [Arcicella sp. LKC2W]MEA5457983.1 non-canonical purine NTP diphosphatase [Arcicella sp. LKC2W]
MKTTLCFATNNAHKLEEIQAILGGTFHLLSLKDINCNEELPETGNTLEANSLQKAQYLYDHYQVNCFADDSGLEVNALNGEPGVYSARYAGEQRSHSDNINFLLKNLSGKSDRSAQFRTVITLIQNGEICQFEGVIKGQIIEDLRGTDGFGYDPVFKPEGFERTFAEMSLEEKGKISHRAKAFEKLVDFLK